MVIHGMPRCPIQKSVTARQLQFVTRQTVAGVMDQFGARARIVVSGGQHKSRRRGVPSPVSSVIRRIACDGQHLFAQADGLTRPIHNIRQSDARVFKKDSGNGCGGRIVDGNGKRRAGIHHVIRDPGKPGALGQCPRPRVGRALEDGGLDDAHAVVGGGVGAAVEIDLVVDHGLIQLRQQLSKRRKAVPIPRGRAAVGGSRPVVGRRNVHDPSRRKHPERIGIVMQGESQLLQVVATLRPAGRFAGLLDRRQQQGNQHGDDGDHHQQFDQRKSPPMFLRRHDGSLKC